jgi:putative transposase
LLFATRRRSQRSGKVLNRNALNLAAATLRHIAGAAWSTKRYLNIELLKDRQMRSAISTNKIDV